jgi:hypothetical protein
MLGNFVRLLRERIGDNCSEPSEKDTTMKTTKKISGIKVNSTLKAGGYTPFSNHSQSGLRVKASIKAGTLIRFGNHNRNGLKVNSSIKAGTLIRFNNHNRPLLSIV